MADVAAVKQEKVETEVEQNGDQTQAAEQVEDNTFKVFVGNLAFATTEETLKTYFDKAGKVVDANIITRGTRSLGYGFISYDTEEEAKKAADTLDKSELDGRQINVEQAKVKQPGEVRTRAPRPPRGGRGGFAARRGRGRSYAAGRGERAAGEARVDDEAQGQEVETKETEGEAGRGRRGGRGGRGRGGRGRGERRFPRTNGGIPSGEPGAGETSKTTLFVANLPFKVTDEDLSSIFKDYTVTAAHVVKLRNGRSKGFGFVEVADETQQQRVLTELKNVVVDGRELVIKVALASQVTPQAQEEETKEEATATA